MYQNVDNYVKTFEMSINNTHFTRIEERLFCINTRNSHCYMILFVLYNNSVQAKRKIKKLENKNPYT